MCSRRLPVEDSSMDSDYTESDLDCSDDSDTDLTNIGGCSDKDENLVRGKGADQQSPQSIYGNRSREHYCQQLETFDETEFTAQDYEGSTALQLDRIEGLWDQCWTYLGKEEFRSYSTVSVRSLHTFFDWLLDQRRGKGGRRLPGTKYESSLSTYWKQFRLVYERATGGKLDGKINRSMHRVLRKLSKKHGLQKIGRDKACMYVEDQTLVLRTNLMTTEKRYPHGRYRIQAQLYLQLGGFTANRPQAILGLCYRHIQVTLLRDPEGGPHRILLEFTFEFTKKFLGIKDMNTFPLPEIMYDDTLAFSPHVFLLGLLFSDGAFAAYNLTSQEELSRLDIPPGSNELPLRLDKKLDDIPVFRKAVRNSDGWSISLNEALPYSNLLHCLKTLGQITGFRQVTRPYSLRYGGGKAFNENGNVSEAMQNLMMGHASIGTFLRHYLSRRITVDTQAVVRGIQPQDALMRAACTMSRSIDPRRPQRLTLEESSSVNNYPIIRSLLNRRKEMKHRLENATKHPDYIQLNLEINRERQHQRHVLLKEKKERWEYEQPVRDVEQQLVGIKIDVHPVTLPDTMPPAQRELADSVLSQPGSSIEEEVFRRNRAIRAVTLYCGVEEGGMNPFRTKRRSENVVSPAESQMVYDEEMLEAAKVSVFKEKRPRRCWKCVGNTNLPIKDRIYEFSREGDLSRHFKRKHLQHIKEGDRLSCELCRVDLVDKMHLQRHGLDVHGTVT